MAASIAKHNDKDINLFVTTCFFMRVIIHQEGRDSYGKKGGEVAEQAEYNE